MSVFIKSGVCILFWVLLASVGPGSLTKSLAQNRESSGDLLEEQWIAGRDQDEQSVVFGDIRDIAYHSELGLYVLDSDRQMIARYTRDGVREEILRFRKGQGPGELVQPLGLSVSSGGIFVVDRPQQRVVQFGVNGDFVQQHSVPFQPTGVAVVGGRLFVTAFWLSSDSVLYVSDWDGSKRRSVLERPQNWKATAMTGNFESIAPTPTGTLLYTVPHPYRLVEVDAEGNILNEASGHPQLSPIERSTEPRTGNRLVEGARGLAILDSGTVVHLIFDRGNERVYLDLFSRDLSFQQRLDLTDEFPSMPEPVLAAGAGSTLYFAFEAPYPQLGAYTLEP